MRDPLLIAGYVTSAFCSAAVALYLLANVEPAPWVAFAITWVPLIVVVLWAHRDAQRSRLPIVHDWGYFLYLFWPFLLPWHCFRTRGLAGWRLLAKLLFIALAPWLTIYAFAAR